MRFLAGRVPGSRNFSVSMSRKWSPTSQKSGTRRDNRNVCYFPDLSSTPDDRVHLPRRVFISRELWDGRIIAKSPMVWDFPDIWKPGFNNRRIETEISLVTRVLTANNITAKLSNQFLLPSHTHIWTWVLWVHNLTCTNHWYFFWNTPIHTHTYVSRIFNILIVLYYKLILSQKK